MGTVGTVPAWAAADEDPIAEVIVTGSRIRRVDNETASPVQVVRREEIERAGRQNLSEVLRGVVQADNQGSISTAFTGGFASGSSAVSLRGLGVNSTLVLINGRRMSTYGLADDGIRTFVDLNSIPLEAVERVEVLKDGGSAIYGSDAVAGVVNIILRDRYEGVSFGGNFGTSNEDDGSLRRVYGSAGHTGERYNALLVAEASSENAIAQRDRDGYLGTQNLSRFGYFDDRRGSPAAGLGNFPDGSGQAFSAVTPFGTVRVPGGTLSDRINLLPCPEVSEITGVCLYETTDFIQIQPETERVNVLGRANFDFTPNLKGYGEFGYFTSKVESRGTPGSVNDGGVFNPANPASPIVHTTVLPANHPDNPTGVDRTLSLLALAFGGRDGLQESEVTRTILGLTGSWSDDWEWDVGAGYIESQLDDVNFGQIRWPLLQAALNSGEFRIDPQLNSPALIEAISPDLRRTAESSVALADARLSGNLFDLPGGRFGIALGAEYREEETDTPPVPFTDVGEIVGLGFSAFDAKREVSAGYLEVNAPVLRQLELNGAIRYDHYSDFGSSTTPKLGFKLKPLRQLALRGTYAEAFRAPGPAEIGNSASFGFTNIGILTVGNPNLDAEEAESYTAGLVWEPFARTNISIDYYSIKRDNEIVAADQAVVIGDLPVNDVPNSSRPGAVPNSMLFYDDEGDLATISAPFVNASKTDTSGIDIDLRQSVDLGAYGTLSANLIWTHVFSFERELPSGQKFEYAGTHGPFVLSSAGGTPQDRARLELTWNSGPLSLSATLNYTSALDMIDHEGESLMDLGDGTFATTTFEGAYFVLDPNGKVCGVYNPDGTVPNDCEVDYFATVDLFARFKGGENWEVTGSITNLLDKMAPFDPYTYGGLNYNPAFHQAGAVGRFITFGMRYSF